MLTPKNVQFIGAVFAGLAVGAGAFGAHALRPTLIANHTEDAYNLAAQYQFYHALGLLIVGLVMDRSTRQSRFKWTAALMLTGILFFSGSLFALALNGSHFVVFLTPIGGIFFLAGWTWLAFAILRNSKDQKLNES